MNFQVEMGLGASLNAKLLLLATTLGSDKVDLVMTVGVQSVVNEATRLAPYKSGTLKRSIRSEIISRGVVAVGTDVPYARRIEMGFVGADSLGRNYHQAAQPYLRPAVDQNRGTVLSDVARALTTLVGNIGF